MRRKFFHFFLFSVFILGHHLFASLASAQTIPNGLCIFVNNGQMIGHGFVVGRHYVLSAAHVLEAIQGPVDLQCIQNGKLTKITSVDPSRIKLHPKRLNPSHYVQGISDPIDLKTEIRAVSEIYDLGFLSLEKPLQTNFILDGSRSLQDTIELVDALNAQGFKEAIPKVTQTDFEFAQSSRDLEMTDWTYSKTRKGLIDVGMWPEGSEPKMYVGWDMKIKGGDSGSPLVVDSAAGKLLVIGITVRTGMQLPEARSLPYQNEPYGVFVRSVNVVDLIQNHQPLLSPEAEILYRKGLSSCGNIMAP